MLLQLATTAVLARLVAPHDFGLIAATTLIYSFLALFSEILIAPALIQRAEIHALHIRTGFLVTVVAGFLISLLFAFAGPLIESLLKIDGLAQTAPFMAIVLYLQVLAAVPDALAVRALEFRTVAMRELASYAFGYMLFTLPLAMMGYGVWALIAGQVAKGAVGAGLLIFIKRQQLGFGFDRQALREVMQFGGGFTLVRLLNMTATQGDNVVVGRMLGAEMLGLYDRAYMLMKIPAAIYQRVAARVFFSALSRVQNEPDKLKSGFMRGVQLSSLFGLCISGALLALAHEWVLIFLGPRWLALVPAFSLMVFATYPRLAYKSFQAMLHARGKVYLSSAYQLVYACLVIGGAIIGCQYGLVAAAAAVSIAVTIHALNTARGAMRECGVTWLEFLRLHLPGLLSGNLILAVGWLPSLYLPAEAPLWLHFSVKAGLMLLLAALLLLSDSRLFLGEHGRWLRKEILGRIVRRRPPAARA